MEMLIVGVAVVAGLGVFFHFMKLRQARRFQEIGGAGPGPFDPDGEETSRR